LNKIFFPGLNALRFFAAYLVLMHHSETIRAKMGLPNLSAYSLFKNGSLAVSFFFVLSGFLITYLLLVEIKTTQTVAIKKFYWRRVFRIWPLYFLMVTIGLFIVPYALEIIHYNKPLPYNKGEAFVLFALFLPFVVNARFGSHFLEPLWSIGVEEQFYWIWAPLLKFLKNQVLLALSLVLVIKCLLIGYVTHYLPEGNLFREVVLALKFELMAIGGIGSWCYFVGRVSFVNSLTSRPTTIQILFLSMLTIRITFHDTMCQYSSFYTSIFNTPVLNTLIEGGLFLWLIMNTALNPQALFKFKNKTLDFLGEISYGIYMYQMLIIFGIILVGKKWLAQSGLLFGTLIYYIIASLLVVAVSYISKRGFEDYFLKIKKRFG
jgi:peptidoglycan/LPS O-acetylase OafA/YrhL